MDDPDDEDHEGEDYSDALTLESDLGDYRITGYLGRGTFGITYRAREMNLRRDVAIKEYMPHQWARRYPDRSIGTISRKTSNTFRYGLERFTMEAQNLAACRQDNIVKVHRLLEDNCTSYMVMELLEGETLQAMIARKGRLDWADLGPIFQGLLDGCREIHRRGILHRDIKPANIVLRDADTDRDGGADSCQPVLIDFGAAREIQRQAAGKLSAILTDGYAPLEQYSDALKQGLATDLYAMAATIYHAMTGVEPTPAPARQAGEQMPPATVAARERAPEDVLRAIDHALRLEAAQRPQSVDEWVAEMPSLSKVVGAGGRRQINRRAVLALAGGAVLTGGAAYIFFSRPDILSSARPLRVEWARDFDALGPRGFKPAVAATSDGAYVVASSVAGDSVRMLALRLDASGMERGRWTSSESNAQGFAVLPAPDGGAFVGGGVNMLAGDDGTPVSGEGLLVRLDPAFGQRWRLGFDRAVLNSLMLQPSGELLAAFDGINRSGVAMLQRVSAGGQAIGGRIELNDRSGDSARKVIALEDGTLAVLGFRESGPTTKSIWISCVNTDGRELWRTSDSGATAEHGFAWSEGSDLVAGGDGLFVVGRGILSGNDSGEPLHRSLAMRLAADGGGIRWLRGDYEPAPTQATANAAAQAVAAVGQGAPAVYLAGWHGEPYQGWLRQIDGAGNVVWANEAFGPRGFVPTRIHLNDEGGYAAGVFTPNPQTVKLMVVRLVKA